MIGGPALAGLVSVGLARMNGVGWNDALKGGALTALSGYAAMGIGSLRIENLGLASLAHGVTQGGIAELGGGEFRSGFWSGAIGHAVSGVMRPGGNGMMSIGNGGPTGIMARTAIAAVAGGTVSWLGGGKFANGAKTAAFVHLFNAETTKLTLKIKGIVDVAIDSNGTIDAKGIYSKGGAQIKVGPDGSGVLSYEGGRATFDGADLRGLGVKVGALTIDLTRGANGSLNWSVSAGLGRDYGLGVSGNIDLIGHMRSNNSGWGRIINTHRLP